MNSAHTHRSAPAPQDYVVFRSGAAALDGGIGAHNRVALVGRVVGLSAPTPDPSGLRATYTLKLRDLDEDLQVDSVPFCDRALMEDARFALRSGAVVVVFGAFLSSAALDDDDSSDGERPRPRRKARILFQVERLCRASKPTYYCGRTPQQIRATDALIDRLCQQGERAISDFVLSEFHQLAGVATGSLSARFQRGERLTLLQALSGGMVRQGVNDRLSLLAVSAPGSGKKVLSDLACFVSPVNDLIQPGLLSPAGLGARVEYRGGWTAMPGVAPRTSGGILVFEDLHRLDKSDLNRHQAILMTILEDAKVAPSKAAAASYEARVALHLNANPQSILGGTEASADGEVDPLARFLELNIPYDVASRIDVILPIHGSDDAAQAALEMVCQDCEEPAPRATDPDAGPEPLRPPEGDRARRDQVRLLLARLQERFPTVSMAGLRPQLRKLLQDLTLVIRQAAAKLSAAALKRFDVDGLFRRMANSVRKLLGATARLKGRGHATAEDVQEVWGLLQGKLEVIQWVTGAKARLEPLGRRVDVVQAARDQSEERFSRVLQRFGGQQATAAAIAAELGEAVSVVQRELLDRGYAPEKGVFTLPTELAHLQQQAELLRRGEDFLPVAPEQEDDLVAFDGAEPLTPYQTLEQEVRALVPAPVAELVPLVAPLRGLCDDDLALGHFNGNMDMLMQEEPPHPTAVPTAARGIVNALTRFAPLAVAAMAPAVAVLCHGEAGVRGFHLLTLLVAADYPGVVGLLEGWAMRPKPEPLEGFLRQIAERGDAARAEERRRNPPPPERPRPEQQYRSAYGRQHFADEWVEPEPLVYPLRR